MELYKGEIYWEISTGEFYKKLFLTDEQLIELGDMIEHQKEMGAFNKEEQDK